MGIDQEDEVIYVSQLIKLWVAEGFVKSNKTQSLEAVARGYFKDLIDRNLLISSYTSKWAREKKRWKMHDLLRDLCLKIAEKENFICVMRAGRDIEQGIVDKARRIVFQQGASSLEQTSPDLDVLESALPLTRSLVSYEDLRYIKFFKLLRVLNMGRPWLRYRDGITKQVNLRFVRISNADALVSSISLLWNLQTLISKYSGSVIALPEIWQMRQLRHVNIHTVQLPDPPPLMSSNQLPEDDELVLPNLQSLKRALNLSLSEQVCKRIPNLKKLATLYTGLSGNLSSFDFGRLQKLESLNCRFDEKPNVDDLLQSLTFPNSLQKLELRGCHLRWEDLSRIGSLPHLQVLQLDENSVTGPEWSLAEGDQFLGLKLLSICCCDLMSWNINNSDDYNYSSSTTCFPVLEELVLIELLSLKEIPSCIGEIPTLGFIHVVCCSESAAISAMEILDEQQSLGNDGLQVEIKFYDKDQSRSFKEKVQHMDCFTTTSDSKLHLTECVIL